MSKNNIKKFKNLVFFSLFVFGGLILSNFINLSAQASKASSNTSNNRSSNSSKGMIGGQRDSHGCLPSAGYSWCELGQSCARPWELASCFEANLGQDFTDFANKNVPTAAMAPEWLRSIPDSSNSNGVNRSIKATWLCDPKNSFWANISPERQQAVVQACFSANSKNTRVNSPKASDTRSISGKKIIKNNRVKGPKVDSESQDNYLKLVAILAVITDVNLDWLGAKTGSIRDIDLDWLGAKTEPRYFDFDWLEAKTEPTVDPKPAIVRRSRGVGSWGINY